MKMWFICMCALVISTPVFAADISKDMLFNKCNLLPWAEKNFHSYDATEMAAPSYIQGTLGWEQITDVEIVIDYPSSGIETLTYFVNTSHENGGVIAKSEQAQDYCVSAEESTSGVDMFIDKAGKISFPWK